MCSDINRRTLIVDCRGFSCSGAINWPIPRDRDQDEVMRVLAKVAEDFWALFLLQVLTDAREDTAWATASAMMPSYSHRVRKAALDVPAVREQRYVSEDAAIGREG